ncbi:MAG: ADP-ribosylglycohydrolase family protein [Anaerolineae bacterium]|nr:ADP-ribosylglycohydrolase family protein [Anaerolineae bacterium]
MLLSVPFVVFHLLPTLSWERIAGTLLGLAIGDTLGNTSESQNPDQRHERYGVIRDYLPNRYANGRAVGLPSDDAQPSTTRATMIRSRRLWERQ